MDKDIQAELLDLERHGTRRLVVTKRRPYGQDLTLKSEFGIPVKEGQYE